MSSKKSKKQARHKVDGEFGGVRRIDFKNVFTVINFDMPENSAGYIHRIGRTGRAFNTGVSVSLVINFDMPENSAGYIHRIGRTGRAFNTGVSVSLQVSLGEDAALKADELYTVVQTFKILE
ncbi:DEAD-box ATP-dependent RNA helicase 16-like isoform X1 [Zingiber officinale]|uniref:DEAD-box ATP-dependent RNA helicase 16-like isoform X1 n=1 Tax=Zingiber officinale TaxID=94328 RepID=UPI001C4CA9A7|nr:DEAD-box ATP-dependent RNA helicase 16-like isoform X1 [Zingiber officinale]